MLASVRVLALICCVHHVMCIISNNLNQFASQKISSDITNGRLQRPSPECSLLKDTGECKKQNEKYYFDVSTGLCRSFNYTGCGGNLNNFVTIEKCNRRCVCSNPKDNGQGTKRNTRYFYNVEMGSCQSFKYRGSGGNANRFFSLSACQSVCEHATVRHNCNDRPEVGQDCNNNSTVQFYYDRHCNCCRKFTYLGCGGNKNKFQTRESCQQKCKLETPSTPAPNIRPQKPAFCFFQNVYGNCNQILIRYFYDNRLGRCVPFTYSGCGGTKNNFKSLQMCKTTCDNEQKASLFENTVNVKIESDNYSTTSPSSSSETTPSLKPGRPTKRLVPDICTKKPQSGNCIFSIKRYYYDTKLGACHTFDWTGCGGNSNRFFTQSQCESSCILT